MLVLPAWMSIFPLALGNTHDVVNFVLFIPGRFECRRCVYSGQVSPIIYILTDVFVLEMCSVD